MSKQKQKNNLRTQHVLGELVVFMYRTGKSMNNLLSFCGLVDARISASEKDLPVQMVVFWCRKSRKLRQLDLYGIDIEFWLKDYNWPTVN